MKKIASLLLSLALVLGLAAPALASELSTEESSTRTSTVSYTGEQEGYIVTVPTSITAGGSEESVTVTGAWDVDKTLTVTAPTTVELANGDETANATVHFDGITQPGDSTKTFYGDNAISKSISVDKPEGVIFGTWTGTLTYTVTFTTLTLESISAKWVGSASVYAGAAINKNSISVTAAYNDGVTSKTLASDEFTVDPAVWPSDSTTPITITYGGKTCTLNCNGITIKQPMTRESISSVTGWNEFVSRYNSGDPSYADNITVSFTVDFDLEDSGTEMMSLGTATRPFKGTVSGGTVSGGTVSNLSGALFGYLGDGAVIESVKFDNANISSGSLFGNVVGNNVSIKNVEIKNSTLKSLFGTVSYDVTLSGKAQDCSITTYKTGGEGTVNHLEFNLINCGDIS